MTSLLIFAGIEAAALLLLVVLIFAAPEAIEDEKGFRVIGPSLWQRLRERWNSPAPVKGPPMPSMRGPTRA